MRPAPRKAKAKAASKENQAVALPPKGKTVFERVFYGDEISDSSDEESDFSEYEGRKRKRPRRTKTKKSKKRKVSLIRRSPTPEAPEISEIEEETIHEEDSRLFEPPPKIDFKATRQDAIPNDLRLEVRGGDKAINIDLSKLLKQSFQFKGQHLMNGSNDVTPSIDDAEEQSELDTTLEDIIDPNVRSKIRRLLAITVTKSARLCYQALKEKDFDYDNAADHLLLLVERKENNGLDGPTLVEAQQKHSHATSKKRVFKPTKKRHTQSIKLDSTRACFLNLEPDLRNRIYRLVLVAEDPIRFSPAKGNARTASLLRTCRQVHTESRGILYGENTFHFARVNSTRGSYYEREWKEIGYKDVRRFLEDIGTKNRSHLRYVSFDFSDAAPYQTPRLEAAERRFVNDPIVFSVLKMIASSGAILNKFVVGFTGRQNVQFCDFHFLKALTGVRCHELTNTGAFGQSKVYAALVEKMKEVMEVPRPGNFDETKQRQNAKMLHEKPSSDTFSTFSW